MPVKPVAENINFPEEEEKVAKFWKDIDAFKTSLKQSKNRPRYTFYDGPPFATGLPHYGHILAGTVKDVVTRWAHQSGFHVDRRFGWDCHGLPVEYEIDKTLNIHGPEDVAKMGIEKYNAECRKIVSRYATEWEQIIGRLGRWIDFHNDYKTMYPWFMESIWWIFKQLYDKGLVYKGAKVMPFSTKCNTPLSNFEAGQNYKDVNDPAVIVSFPLKDEPEVKVLAWTTTPWTLPSNLTLCVHPELDYVKVKDVSNGNIYIMMEARVSALFKSEEEYKVLQKFKGKMLEGKSYSPPFDYFEFMRKKGAFRILNDTYVTSESGTGVVHQAPYFGEDDYRCNLNYNIITKDMEPLCPVDMCGRFTLPVRDFEGEYVKDADKNIIKMLKENGCLISHSTCNHSYPFCWRSDTPLIYRAVPSWFVRVEHMQQKLLESNSQTYWVPDFVKEKRFGNWLRDARDWAVSRNRYWGTPIPLWVSDDGQEVVCVGSIQELKELTGRDDITDLHREFVDKLTIPSKMGKGVLRRVSEVFDCWFESGSMPYAQAHFPFENKREFEDSFPGDFIAEGIDQTRGWFYTLLVLSTALFGKAPFKNLICHGLVLAADAHKMSKRKKNYPDPMDIVNRFGADAVRLYLINSPVVRADNLRFKEEGVRDVLKDVFLPWFNAYRFLMQNIGRLEVEEGHAFEFTNVVAAENYMDRWIISFTQTLIKFVKQEMAAYRLYTVVPRLVKFVEQLTNWYVRMNRKRLKGEGGLEDCDRAVHTLFGVLFSMTKVMAPFIPFLTEHMYQNMKNVIRSDRPETETASVHFLMLPEANEDLMDGQIELAVSRMQTVIELGRVVRERNTMPMKYPLSEVVVIHRQSAVLADVQALQRYVKEELNVRTVTISQDKVKYGVHLQATPDFKALGARLKGDLKKVMAALKTVPDSELEAFQKSGALEVCGHTLGPDDLKLSYTAKNESGSYEAHSDGDLLILLDVTPDQSMLDEGLAREVINRVQKLRKKAKLTPHDDITIYYTAGGDLPRIVAQQYDFIQLTVKQPMVSGGQSRGAEVIISDSSKIKDDTLELTFVRGHHKSEEVAMPTLPAGGGPPVCSYINIMMHTMQAGQVSTQMGTILLENPRGERKIDAQQVEQEVRALFGVPSQPLYFYDNSGQKLSKAVVDSSVSTWLHVALSATVGDSLAPAPASTCPCCCYVNVASGSRTATVLLENPRGQYVMRGTELAQQVALVFGAATRVALYKQQGRKDKLELNGAVTHLHGRTVYAEI